LIVACAVLGVLTSNVVVDLLTLIVQCNGLHSFNYAHTGWQLPLWTPQEI
jgi:hypothetical protein